MTKHLAPYTTVGADKSLSDPDDVKIFVGMMDGLAFLPLAHINAGVAILQNVCPDPSLIPLLVYFLDTCAGSFCSKCPG